MNETIDIGWLRLLWVYAMLVIPAAALYLYNRDLLKPLFVGTLRMTAQLALVGFFLRYLFAANHPILTGLWILVMIGTANTSIVAGAKVKIPGFFFTTLLGTAAGTLPVAAVFIFLAVHPSPIWDARYLIPVTGMIIGNSLRGNMISIERFFAGVAGGQKLYQSGLTLGATPREAAKPFMKTAFTAALSPNLATMATMGLVSLPGMMTGQMLGGSDPAIAIKYQIAIMIAIITSAGLSAAVNIEVCLRLGFDGMGLLKDGVVKD